METLVYLEYRLSDGVVEKTHETEPQPKEGYGLAKTTGFTMGDEIKNFIVVNSVDEEGNLTSCSYIKEPASGEYLRKENLKLREENLDLIEMQIDMDFRLLSLEIGGM